MLIVGRLNLNQEMKITWLSRLLAITAVSLPAALLEAVPFRAELKVNPDGLSAELSHPGRRGAEYVIEEAPSLAGPWSTSLSY